MLRTFQMPLVCIYIYIFKIAVIKTKTYDVNLFFQYLLIVPGILYPYSYI